MSKGSKKKPGPAPKSEQRAKAEPVPGDEATSKAEQQSAAELEACFMKALEKRMGGLEMTEDNVRKMLLAMSPEEQRALAEEGEALKRELLQNEEHADEAKKFRAEVNKNAEARGLPTEADGEHLTKGVLAFLNAEGDEASGPVPIRRLLLMLASSPYLAKLALADAAAGGQTGEAPPGRAREARAEPADIDALEQALAGLEVDGFAPDQRAGRPPFVRRNLTLLCGHLHRERLPESLVLRDSTKRAQGAAAGRASKLSEMLFRYALQNRWVKPALAATEVQALLTNGLWDGSEAAKRRMAERMAEAGLKLPRLKMAVSATDARPGRKVTVKAEVYRTHVYSEEEAAALEVGGESAAAHAVDKAAEERAAQGQVRAEAGAAPSEAGPQEGWWVVGEAIRENGDVPVEAAARHNALVGFAPLTAPLTLPTMTCEFSFDAPETPGEYKVMVHCRSTGCVGVDVRKKVTFKVLPAIFVKRPAPAATAKAEEAEEEAREREPREEQPPPLEAEAPPPLIAAA